MVPVRLSVSVRFEVTGRMHLNNSRELILVKVVVGFRTVWVMVEKLGLEACPKTVKVVVVMKKTVGPPESRLKLVPTAPNSVMVDKKTRLKEVKVSGTVSVAVKVVLAVLLMLMVWMNSNGLVTVKLI